MKVLLLFAALFMLSAWAPGAEISKADILATVEHLRALTRDAQTEALDAKEDAARVQKVCNSLADQLKAAQEEVVVEKAKADLAGRERDVVVIAFSLLCALYFGSMLAGMPLREFPSPYGLLAAAAIYVAIFAMAFASARLLLHEAAHLVP